MDTKVVNKEEIVSGTHSEDSVTLYFFPHCECSQSKCIVIFVLMHLFLFISKKNENFNGINTPQYYKNGMFSILSPSMVGPIYNSQLSRKSLIFSGQ